MLGQLWDGGRSALRRLAYSMRRPAGSYLLVIFFGVRDERSFIFWAPEFFEVNATWDLMKIHDCRYSCELRNKLKEFSEALCESATVLLLLVDELEQLNEHCAFCEVRRSGNVRLLTTVDS